MKLLIIGGTVFLGRHVVNSAVERGHEVTVFTRGQSAPQGFHEGVEHLLGDRDGNLEALRGRSWDAVIDICGYVPRVVRQSAELLKDSVGLYTFISTISVYSDFTQPGLDETGSLLELPDSESEDVQKYYGELKVLCERVVQETYPSNALIIRPGLIVGPYDKTDRFTYWPTRSAKGGAMLAPGAPDRHVQFIDARDLADWTVKMTEAQATGIYNATGPEQTLTMEQLLNECVAVSESDGQLVWVPNEFLVQENVGEWMELPLWIASEEMKCMMDVSVAKALANGLTLRPLSDTIYDTWQWDSTRPADLERRAGMKPDKETSVLAAWTQTQSVGK